MAREPETYTRESLTDLVDGAADDYLRYGLDEAVATEYRRASAQRLSLRVEIFSLASELDAFGLLADEVASVGDLASVEAPGVLEIGELGLLGPGRLSFVKGRLFANLLFQDEDPDATEATLDEGTREHLPVFARALARTLPGECRQPPELSALPRGGRVRRSERYFPAQLPAPLAPLGRGLEALYGDPGPRFRLAIPLGLDEATATARLAALRQSLGRAEAVAELGDEAFQGRTSGGELVFATRRASTLAVAVTGEAGPRPRDSTLRELLSAALAPPQPDEPADPRPWNRERSGRTP